MDEEGSAGFVDFRTASTVASTDQLDRDMAATVAAMSVVAGPERTVASAVRCVPPRPSSARFHTCNAPLSIRWLPGP